MTDYRVTVPYTTPQGRRILRTLAVADRAEVATGIIASTGLALALAAGGNGVTITADPLTVAGVATLGTIKNGTFQAADGTAAFSIANGTGKVTIAADFQVNGVETIVGGVVFDGDVTFGDATTDTVDFLARIGSVGNPDLVLKKEINHAISVADSTTINTLGGNLSITSGGGTGTQAGGNLTLNANTSTGAGGSGDVSIGSANTNNINIGGVGTSTVIFGGSNFYLGASAAVVGIGGTTSVNLSGCTGTFQPSTGSFTWNGTAGAGLTLAAAGAFAISGAQASQVITSTGAPLTITGAGASTWSTSGGALTVSGQGGINVQKNSSNYFDVGVTSASVVTMAAGISLVSAAGAGALDFRTATGDTYLTTGSIHWTGAAAKTMSLVGASSITLTAGAASTWSTSSGALSIDGSGGINLKKATATYADVGATAASKITLAAGISLSAAAGATGLDLGSATGDTNLPTGTLGWAGATGKAASIVSTAAAITLTAAAASTWSTSSGALTLTSAAAATWSTAAGALTLTSAAAATWSTASGALSVDGFGGLNLKKNGTTYLDAGVTTNSVITAALPLTVKNASGITNTDGSSNGMVWQQFDGTSHQFSGTGATTTVRFAMPVVLTSTLTQSGGTVGLSATGVCDFDATGALSINSSADVINIGDDAVAQNINVGTGAAARTITIGNVTGATALTLNAGTGTIGIGTGAQARTVNIATGAAAQVVTLGSNTGASSLSLNCGTGNLNIGTAGAARSISIGTSSSAQQIITIGSTNSASSIKLVAGTGNIDIGIDVAARSINLGTGGAAQTVTVGSTNTTSSLVLQSGSGNVAVDATSGSVTLGATNATAITLGRTGVTITQNGNIIGVGTTSWNGNTAWFGATAAAQQTSAANLTNNVTSGGTDNTIANYTDLTIYANDAAAIRNNIYQLARKLKQVNDALRVYGLLS